MTVVEDFQGIFQNDPAEAVYEMRGSGMAAESLLGGAPDSGGRHAFYVGRITVRRQVMKSLCGWFWRISSRWTRERLREWRKPVTLCSRSFPSASWQATTLFEMKAIPLPPRRILDTLIPFSSLSIPLPMRWTHDVMPMNRLTSAQHAIKLT